MVVVVRAGEGEVDVIVVEELIVGIEGEEGEAVVAERESAVGYFINRNISPILTVTISANILRSCFCAV